MKKLSLRIVAASIAIAFAGMSQAQTRHDEKPHGMPGKPSAAPDSPVTDRAPGRHDERPHGKPKGKTKAVKKIESKKKDDASK